MTCVLFMWYIDVSQQRDMSCCGRGIEASGTDKDGLEAVFTWRAGGSVLAQSVGLGVSTDKPTRQLMFAASQAASRGPVFAMAMRLALCANPESHLTNLLRV